MRAGARTPEELETLFEDACLTRDLEALAALFDRGAVLVAGERAREARGVQAIADAATAIWRHDQAYLADPRRVLQARDTVLVLARHGTHVLRRGSDGAWRYAISLLALAHTTQEE